MLQKRPKGRGLFTVYGSFYGRGLARPAKVKAKAVKCKAVHAHTALDKVYRRCEVWAPAEVWAPQPTWAATAFQAAGRLRGRATRHTPRRPACRDPASVKWFRGLHFVALKMFKLQI